MKKSEFMNLMKFPEEWDLLEMYPDELFAWQESGYEVGHEDGSEHDRNGAFHWWLRRNPTKTELAKLIRLAAIDPDPMLGVDVLQYIHKAVEFDSDLATLERSLFGHRVGS